MWTILYSCPDFYPRSPCGERHITTTTICTASRFLSTLSLRRATETQKPKPTRQNQFLSTLSLRRATLSPYLTKYHFTDFYPRSPCGERQGLSGRTFEGQEFLSTLSLRRATIYGGGRTEQSHYFYPRSPCGERHPSTINHSSTRSISIHALLAESDLPRFFNIDYCKTFLSTLSLRRAT